MVLELSELAKQNHCDLFMKLALLVIPIRTIVIIGADQGVGLRDRQWDDEFYFDPDDTKWTLICPSFKLRRKGFAEADPTNDVKGKDAAYKMIILTQFAFGKDITVDDVKLEGIDGVQLADINYQSTK